MNHRWFILFSSVFAIPHAVAQETVGLKLSDLNAQGAIQLTKEQLQTLLPGAKVVSLTPTGSTRRWGNDADGTFIASSDARGSFGRKASTAPGTWFLGDNASYCVQIEWKSHTEQWCRYIFKAGDKYFGVRSVSDLSSQAHELLFER
ncbi:MAG: hypothetical protein JNL84_13910 [Candidatus Accumulibacter sp.]|nr:hypothetical protein [Accumulibacter sp.]